MVGLEGTWLGNYHLLRRLGGGAISEVYLAEQRDVQQQVAVKVLPHAAIGMNPQEQRQIIQQFHAELRAVASLKHPHIIPLYDFGEQNSITYLVMEYFPFGSLADFLTFAPMQRYRFPLPPPLVADVINQAAGAIQFIHDHQMGHLGIKPQNLLLKVLPLAQVPPVPLPGHSVSHPYQVPAGEIPVQIQLIVADLAISRLVAWLSAQRGIAPPPLFTAPEQLQGRPGPTTDQYALAGVAYLLLTGETVFKGTPPELHQQHLSMAPRLPSEINPHLPAALNGVLARALAKDPMQRFPRIQDFGQALQQAASTSGQWLAYSLPMSAVGPRTAAPPAAPLVAMPPSSGQPAAPAASSPAPGWPETVSPPQDAPPGPVSGNQSAPQGSQPVTGATVVPPGWAQVPAGGGMWTDAETVTNLAPEPLVPVAGSPSGPSPRADILPAGQAQFASRMQASPLAPYREPDAPRAPLPPSAQKFVTHRRSPFTRWQGGIQGLPLWQRLVFGALALLLVAGSVAVVFLVFLHQSPAPAVSQLHITTQSLTRYGVQNGANFPALTGKPQAVGKVIVRPRTTTPPTTPRLNSNLPVLSIAAEAHYAFSNYPSTLPAPQDVTHPVAGLNQQQMGGIDAPIDLSLASNGTTTIEVVDSALLEISGNSTKRIDLAAFFQQPLSAGGVLAEPRILFESRSGKWILVANQLNIASSGAIKAGFFDLALSESADPTGSWDIYQLSTGSTAASGCTWADYPQIGANASDLFLTGASFDCSLNGALRGAVLWDIPFSNLSASQALETIYMATGFTTSQGDPLLTLTPAMPAGSDKIGWLVGNDAGYVTGNQVSKQVAVWAVLTNNQSGKAAAPSIIEGLVTLSSPYADPPLTQQHNSNQMLSTGDARIAQAEFINGHLYAAFTTAMNWEKDSTTRAGIYWIDLLPTLIINADPSKSTLNVRVFQEGLFGDPNNSFFYPSLVADSFGNVVLFSETAGPTLEPHLVFTSRLSGDPLGTMGSGKNFYIFLPGTTAPYTGSHWGDYVGGALGPTSSDGKKASIWIAGPRVAFGDRQWKTDIWTIPTKEV